MGSLLPQWLEFAWATVFAAVAGSHLRHMWHTAAQRRAWHACHVLMAAGMAFMYLPPHDLPVTAAASFWQVVFALAGTLAALWALAGTGTGTGSTIVWLLTALDLGVMLLMWSRMPMSAALAWAAVIYLIAEAVLWLFDIYRRIDGAGAVIDLRALASGGGTITFTRGERLLGEIDITVSMVLMAAGMAYMIIAMTLF